MSFSQTVKGELIDAQYTEPCCRKAFLYGMCLFGKSFSSRQVALQTENPTLQRNIVYCWRKFAG